MPENISLKNYEFSYNSHHRLIYVTGTVLFSETCHTSLKQYYSLKHVITSLEQYYSLKPVYVTGTVLFSETCYTSLEQYYSLKHVIGYWNSIILRNNLFTSLEQYYSLKHVIFTLTDFNTDRRIADVIALITLFKIGLFGAAHRWDWRDHRP